MNLKGADHVTPSDLVWLAKGAIKTGTMGPEKTVAAIRDYIAAFLDTNLRSEPEGPLLTGPSAEYPEASLTTRSPSLYGGPDTTPHRTAARALARPVRSDPLPQRDERGEWLASTGMESNQ